MSVTFEAHRDEGSPAAGQPLLAVQDLRVEFRTRRGTVQALDGVSYELHRGRTLAVVGESGSGKSVTVRAVMGLLPPAVATVTGGRILLDGENLLEMAEPERRAVRGARVAMVFQDSLSALNPVLPVGFQIVESLRRAGLSRAGGRRRAIELMDQVGIPSARSRVNAFPHEFSGGMRQRVMIAMALAQDPEVLIADEPTTALDVTIQAQILRLLADVQADRNMGMVLITHDMGVVANTADEMAVMYQGKVVERGTCAQVFAAPTHSHTKGLLAAIPRAHMRGGALPVVESADGTVGAAPAAAGGTSRRREAGRRTEDASLPEPTPALQVTDLVKRYPLKRSAGAGRFRRGELTAVAGVTLSVPAGRTLGVVGESGSGKSTLAKMLVGVERPTSGTISMLGEPMHELSGSRMRRAHRNVQLVFQDPYTSLDPRLSVRDLIAEPLSVHSEVYPRRQRAARIRELLDMVGLSADMATRLPHQLSGGQRQRVGIARALALQPKVLVLDEPVSALDTTVQAQIVNLLSDLQSELGLTYVFIAHDLAVVGHLSDEIVVMYRGRVVEQGDYHAIFEQPTHPYTISLLSAIPEPDPSRRAEFGSRVFTDEAGRPAFAEPTGSPEGAAGHG